MSAKPGMRNRDLWYADFQGASLSGIGFTGSYPEAANAQMAKAVLTSSVLLGASLDNAQMNRADLSPAHTTWVNARGDNYYGSSHVDAAIADLADYRGATGLTQEMLCGMVDMAATLLPDDPGLAWSIFQERVEAWAATQPMRGACPVPDKG